MKSTDIPNGYVILGPAGCNILVDFDDKGKAENRAMEISISGWPENMMDKGKVKFDVLVLVHTVKGEASMLVKRLKAIHLAKDEKPIAVAAVAKSGLLPKMAEQIYQDHVKELERLDGLKQQIEEADKKP